MERGLNDRRREIGQGGKKVKSVVKISPACRWKYKKKTKKKQNKNPKSRIMNL